jgi:hypothetical protein
MSDLDDANDEIIELKTRIEKLEAHQSFLVNAILRYRKAIERVLESDLPEDWTEVDRVRRALDEVLIFVED